MYDADESDKGHSKKRKQKKSASLPDTNLPASSNGLSAPKAMGLLVIDTMRLPAKEDGRYYLTLFADLHSTAVIALDVTKSVPTAASVLSVLAPIASGPRPWLARGIHTNPAGTFWGLPSGLVLDDNLEFSGTALARFCEGAGINIVRVPRWRPEVKAPIERLFAVIDRYFSETHSKYVAEEAVGNRMGGRPTSEERLVAHLWCIITKKHNENAPPGKTSPWRRFQESLATYGTRVPPLDLASRVPVISRRKRRLPGTATSGRMG